MYILKRQKQATKRGAAIAQWIRLCLPSCRPCSSPKNILYAFLIYSICDIFEKDEN